MPDDTVPEPIGTGSWSDVFKDVRGSYSAKRVLAFIAMSVYLIGFYLATFTHLEPSKELMQGFFSIVMAGMGLAGLEHFTSGK